MMNVDEIRLGIIRDTMNDNPLLMKSELGRPLRRCYTLPGADFVYGLSGLKPDGGVAEAMIFHEHIPSLRYKLLSKDYVSLNKGAAIAGMVTAKEFLNYRKQHDVRKRVIISCRRREDKNIRLPNIAFGIRTLRPQTPMADLIQNQYQARWIKARWDAEAAERARLKQKKKLDRHIYETRAALLRKFQPPVEGPPLWHMAKYEKRKPHLDTFPTADDRVKAFKHHRYDATSRYGIFGQGIYEAAKT